MDLTFKGENVPEFEPEEEEEETEQEGETKVGIIIAETFLLTDGSTLNFLILKTQKTRCSHRRWVPNR